MNDLSINQTRQFSLPIVPVAYSFICHMVVFDYEEMCSYLITPSRVNSTQKIMSECLYFSR